MSRLASLLQAILDDPDDDELHLIYADCLEDDGQTVRAELIRVQIALGRTPDQDPRWSVLRERARHLLATQAEVLYAGLPDWVSATEAGKHTPAGTFARGFIERVATSAARF